MIFSLLFSLTFCSTGFAKFVQDESAAGLTLSYTRTYDIKKNFMFKSTTEHSTKIVDENSLSKDAVRVITFNPKFITTKILSAKVINGDLTEEVKPDQIILKDAESEISNSFDSQKSYVINFPNAKVGSILYYKIEQESLPSEADANFYYFAYSVQTYANEWKLLIRSEAPLHRYFKDAGGHFGFTSEFKDGHYLYSAKSLKPLRTYIAGEDNIYDRTDRFSFFYFSSAKDWRTFSPKLRTKYIQIKNQDPPEKLKAVLKSIPEGLSEYARVSQMLEAVVPHYRYFSDMRRINGEMIPRNLAEIEKSGYADCKDIASYLSAALTRMGIKNNVALVWRGVNDVPEDSSFELAMEANFNHAVVRAEIDGKEYWIDGTNRNIYFDIPHPDIAGRKAALVEEDGLRLVDIPSFSAKDSIYEEQIDYEFAKNSKFTRLHSRQKNKGYIAYQTLRDDLSMQGEMRDFYLTRAVTGASTYRNSKVKVDSSKFDSKKEISIDVEAEVENVGFRTTSGLGFTLPQSGRLGRFVFNINERDGDLALGFPTEVRLVTRLLKKKKVGSEDLGCQIISPWLDYKRSVSTKAQATEVRDELKTKVPFVPNEQIKTPEFAKVQNAIIRCQNSALILQDF